MLLNVTEVTSNLSSTRNLAFSADGEWIAAVPQITTASTTFQVYKKTSAGNFDDPAINVSIPVSNASIDYVTISPNSQKMAVATGINKVYLYNLVGGVWTYYNELTPPARPVSVKYAQDSNDLLVNCNNGVSLVYNTDLLTQLYTVTRSVQQVLVDSSVSADTNIFISSSATTNSTSYGVFIYTKTGGTYTTAQVTNFSNSIYGIKISADGLKIYISTNNGVYILRRASSTQTFNQSIYYSKSTSPILIRDFGIYDGKYLIGPGATTGLFGAYDSTEANKYLEASVLYDTPIDGPSIPTTYTNSSTFSDNRFVAYVSGTAPKVYSVSKKTVTTAKVYDGNTVSGYSTPVYQFVLSKDKTKFFTMFSSRYNNSPTYNFGDVKNGQLIPNNKLSFNNTQAVSVSAGTMSSFSTSNNYFALSSGNVLRIFKLSTDGVYDEMSYTPSLTIAPVVAEFSPNEQYVASFSRTVINVHSINGILATNVTVNLNGATLADLASIVWYSDTQFIVSSYSAGMYFFEYDSDNNRFNLKRSLLTSEYENRSMVLSQDKRFIYAIKNTAVGSFWGAKYTITDFDNISYTGIITDNYSNTAAAIKFIRLSPDGTKLFVTGQGAPWFGVYSVDTVSGDITPITLTTKETINAIAYGCDWLTNETLFAGYNGEYYGNWSLKSYRYNSSSNSVTDDSTLLINAITYSNINGAAITSDAKNIYVSAPSNITNTNGLTRFEKNSDGRYVRVEQLNNVSTGGVLIVANGKYMLAVTATTTNNARLYERNSEGLFVDYTEFTVTGAVSSSFFYKIDENNIVFLTNASGGGYFHYHISNEGVVTQKQTIDRINASSFYYAGQSYNSQYIYFSDTTTNLRIFEKQVSGDYTLKTSQAGVNTNIFRLWSSPTNPSVGIMKISTSMTYVDINEDGTINFGSTIQTNAAAACWYNDGSGFFVTGLNPTSNGITSTYLFDNSSKKWFKNPDVIYPTGSIAGTLINVDKGLDITNPAKDVVVYIQAQPTSISTSTVTAGARAIGIQYVESEKVVTGSINVVLSSIETEGELVTDLAIDSDTLINPITTTGEIDTPIAATLDITLNPFIISGFFGEKSEYDIDLTLTTAFSIVRPDNWSELTTTPLEPPYAYGDVKLRPISNDGLLSLLPDVSGDVLINSITSTGILGEERSISGETIIPSVITDGMILSTPFLVGDVTLPTIETSGTLSDGEEGSIEIILNRISTEGVLEQQQNATIDVTLNSITTEGLIETEFAINGDVTINSITTELNGYIIGNTLTGDVLISSIETTGSISYSLEANIDITLNSITTDGELRVSGNILPSDVLIPSIQTEGQLAQTQEIDGPIVINNITTEGFLETRFEITGNVLINSISSNGELKKLSARRRFMNIV